MSTADTESAEDRWCGAAADGRYSPADQVPGRFGWRVSVSCPVSATVAAYYIKYEAEVGTVNTLATQPEMLKLARKEASKSVKRNI